MKKRSDKAEWKDVVRTAVYGYKLWWDHYPMILVSTAANTIVDALTPYVGIFIAAQIINEIAGQRNRSVLIRWVIISLFSAVILSFLGAVLRRWKNYHRTGEWYKQKKFYADKMMSMDFQDADDPKIRNMLSQINQNDAWGGWGIRKRLLWEFENFVQGVTAIIGSVSLTVTLFTSQIPANAGKLTVLNSPLFVAGIVLLMLAITFLTPALSNKANAYWSKVGEEAMEGNRLYFFFGFIGYDRARALDVRMSRQDLICKKYNQKYFGFGSQSKLASYARGPMGVYNALSASITHLFTAAIYIFVCLKAWSGAFGVGLVTQYIGAATLLSGGVSKLISFFGEMRNNAPYMQTTIDFLELPNRMQQSSQPVDKQEDNNYEIEFRNVSFKYPNSDEYALKDITLKLNRNQRLAVVGENGSGKTTFIKLLCRLYDPTEGIILLNGIDIKQYDYSEYISLFSVVFQDFKLLSHVLGQNIAASTEYNADKARNCINKVGFSKRFDAMSEGLETYLYKDFHENGVEISGGEAQKIALARALYKNAPIIVLDEPTAALDPIAEYEVYSKMDEISGGKATVFISHRLSSCRFCNDIVVFHAGKVIQRGSHNNLVADVQGKYYELWKAQEQYYRDINKQSMDAVSG